MFNSAGFLGTGASLQSDLALILIVFTALLFTIGWQLARRHRYEAHRWIQTSAALLNTIVVMIVMINSFVKFILPGIPGKLGEGSYGLTTVHAALGLISLVLGIYVTLVGNNLLPKKLQFTNYKPYMWVSYILYLLATFTGAVVYIVAFVYGI